MHYSPSLNTQSCNVSKKNLKKFFAPENMKKTPSKVAHNWPPIFFQYWPNCPNGPKTENGQIFLKTGKLT